MSSSTLQARCRAARRVTVNLWPGKWSNDVPNSATTRNPSFDRTCFAMVVSNACSEPRSASHVSSASVSCPDRSRSSTKIDETVRSAARKQRFAFKA